MTHFQHNQLRYEMFHLVDDLIIANATLETAFSFIALHGLVLDELPLSSIHSNLSSRRVGIVDAIIRKSDCASGVRMT